MFGGFIGYNRIQMHFSCHENQPENFTWTLLTGVVSVTIMSHCLHLKFLRQLTHLLYNTQLSVPPYRVPL